MLKPVYRHIYQGDLPPKAGYQPINPDKEKAVNRRLELCGCQPVDYSHNPAWQDRDRIFAGLLEPRKEPVDISHLRVYTRGRKNRWHYLARWLERACPKSRLPAGRIR